MILSEGLLKKAMSGFFWRSARFVSLCLVSSILLLASSAFAAPSSLSESSEDKKAPLKINADKMISDKKNGLVSFFGTVVATKGKLTLEADRMIVYTTEDQGGFTKIEAFDNVRITRGEKVATGRKGVYLADTKKIVITGDPVLNDGKNRATGEKVVYYLDQEDMIITGSDRKRSTLTLYPKDSKAVPAPDESVDVASAEEIPDDLKSDPVTKPPDANKKPEPVKKEAEVVKPEEPVAEPSEEPVVVPIKEPDMTMAPYLPLAPAPIETDMPELKKKVKLKRPVHKSEKSVTKKKDKSYLTLLVGTFEKQKECVKLLVGIKKGGYKAYVLPKRIGKRVVCQVRVGKYLSRDYAEKVAKEVGVKYSIEPVITLYHLSME